MKHIKIFITIVLLLSGACFTTSAQTGTGITFVDNGLKFHILSNEEMTVETYFGSQVGEDGHVTIPSTTTYNGATYTVVRIGWWSFSGKTDLKSIDLPSTITSIESNAFSGCFSLQGITFPDNLQRIGDFAFSECSSLREVIFPEGLVSIGSMSFADCHNLEHIVIPSSVTTIGGGAFRFSAVESVDIPGSVKEVNGFEYCDQLTEVILHEGTTSIGTTAFFTSSLKEIHLPSTITYLGRWAFKDLDDLYIPCHTPPSVYYNGWYYGFIRRQHIPKGTLNHYLARKWMHNYPFVEDETLGVYCDIDRNITGAGSIELDSTVVITNADGFYFVPGGTDLTFTLRPEPKYMIKHVSLNETDITHQLGYGVTLFEDAPNLDLSDKLTEEVAYTIGNMQEAVAINVDYSKNPYSKLSLRQGVGGTLSVRMHCDEHVLMTIVADDDNVFDGVTMNGEPALINDKNIVAVPNLDDPVTIQVNYQQSED